jgi:hypothetical protein
LRFNGATTLSTMTLSITTLSIMALSTMAFSIKTLSITISIAELDTLMLSVVYAECPK